jgi:hypothetical protein
MEPEDIQLIECAEDESPRYRSLLVQNVEVHKIEQQPDESDWSFDMRSSQTLNAAKAVADRLGERTGTWDH